MMVFFEDELGAAADNNKLNQKSISRVCTYVNQVFFRKCVWEPTQVIT